jgi:XapX domain-containing protein
MAMIGIVAGAIDGLPQVCSPAPPLIAMAGLVAPCFVLLMSPNRRAKQ